MIHWCTGEPRYFLSRYEYRYLNGISLLVSQNNKIFLIKNKKLLYQHSEITVLISFMTPYPSTSLFIAAGLRRCLVSLRMLPVMHFSRWQHESMRSFNTLSADTVLCARNKNTRFVRHVGSFVKMSSCYNWHHPLISQRYGKTLDSKFFKVGQGLRQFSLYSCVSFYHLLTVINGN